LAERSLLVPEKTSATNRPKTAGTGSKTASGELQHDAVHPDQLSSGEPPPDELHSDELWMEEALRCAQRALEAGEVPVGAVVVWNDVCNGVYNSRIVGRGWNRNIAYHDPTAHAEVVALREAGATVGNHRLEECTLFVTIEPCAMCAGALVHARLKRLVYGADDPKAGAVHSVMQVLNHPQLNHRIQVQKIDVRSGVLAGRSAEVLQTFFRNRR
jgi:tRNA(adenine34) deaminase